MAQAQLTRIQYWLAEIDQYDNPKLIDGPHSNAQGAHEAAYLIQSMGLGSPDIKFAVAKVELSKCVPDNSKVNQQAVESCRTMVAAAKHKRDR